MNQLTDSKRIYDSDNLVFKLQLLFFLSTLPCPNYLNQNLPCFITKSPLWGYFLIFKGFCLKLAHMGKAPTRLKKMTRLPES